MAGLLSPRDLVVRHRKKLIFVSLLVLAAAACIRELWIWPEREGHFAATVVEVPKGASLGALATVLEQRGLINNSLLFRLYARATGYDRRLQAGVYDVAENLSVHALLQLFASGKVQQHPVRIPGRHTSAAITEASQRGP